VEACPELWQSRRVPAHWGAIHAASIIYETMYAFFTKLPTPVVPIRSAQMLFAASLPKWVKNIERRNFSMVKEIDLCNTKINLGKYGNE
jgi:hypothetical protein